MPVDSQLQSQQSPQAQVPPSAGITDTPPPSATPPVAQETAAPSATETPASDPKPAWDLDAWDFNEKTLPDEHRPFFKKVWSKAEADRKALEERLTGEHTTRYRTLESQLTTLKKEQEARAATWDKQRIDYEKGVSPQMKAIQDELDLYKRLASGEPDPRIADYEKKLKDADLRLAEYAGLVETIQAEQIKAYVADFKAKHEKALSDPSTKELCVKLVEDDWEPEHAIELAQLGEAAALAAAEYANKHRLYPAQRGLAVDYAKALKLKPRKSADLVIEQTGKKAPQDMSNLSLEERRKRYASEILG